MTMKHRLFAGLSGLAALTAGALASNVAAQAETLKHETQFSVKFTGLEVGRATFKMSFDEKSYKLTGSGQTTGIVEWLAPSTGTIKSAGQMIENQLRPNRHEASVKERKKKEESVLLSFAGDRVTDVKFKSNKPRKNRVAPNYIPVEAKHMAAVLDPASTLIIPMSGADAKDGNKVCNHRFPVFDGETRYDIKLRYKQTKPIETNGYKGFAYVCQMRYVPIAGHKKNHRNVKEMAANKKMEIWLAPMGGVSVFTPIQIMIGTKYGRIAAVPKYFGPQTN